MRTPINMNRNWHFIKGFNEAYINSYESEGELIHLPHTHEELPYNYLDETVYQYVSCYQKKFELKDALDNKRFVLSFQGVMTYAEVYINGHLVGSHKGGYTPFHFDISDYVTKDNLLVVKVDGSERSDIPPFGFVIDYLTYGGIYRDVTLTVLSENHIENLFAHGLDVLSQAQGLQVKLQLNQELGIENGRVEFVLKNRKEESVYKTQLELIKGKQEYTFQLQDLPKMELWSIDNPCLYALSAGLISGEDLIDTYETKIGFRQAEFTSHGFYLNGERIIIRGLNRHQSFPYVGYALAKRAQRDDADLLKYDLGLNMVRTSHYPQSIDFLNRCDEVGLLVFEEIPGWQHIGNLEWQEVAICNVEEMIKRDYNHPSIVLWGVRINESGDAHDFYEKTNNLAHQLDITRQTGGVRCIRDSEFLEDVYTYNDFVQGDPSDTDQRVLRPQLEVTGLDHLVPYMVTEYNGHLFPTKRFDQIQRQEEHVRRHLNVLNESALMPHSAGSIGWCAFDYNTHYQFGSGDRICYHGVMDMFRIPKFAAYVYTSQISPKDKLVLEPVVIYAMGEKNMGGITPITILTNLEYIEYWIEDKKFGTYYPATNKYPGLTHPPILVEGVSDIWGAGFHDIEIRGFLNREMVAVKKYPKAPVMTALELVADHDLLSANEIDCSRVLVKAVDQEGNVLPYIDNVVELSIKGQGEILGPTTFSLIGGCRGFWVRSNGDSGQISLRAKELISGLEHEIVIKVL